MGLFRHWLDNDWMQRRDIDRLAGEQRMERRRARRARSDQRKRIETLEQEVEELELVTEAMAHLLVEHGVFDAERLRAMMMGIQERRDAEEQERSDAEEQAQRAKAPRRRRRRRE